MDFNAFLSLVLNRNSQVTIDLTEVPRNRVLIDLTQTPDSHPSASDFLPVVETPAEEQIQILLRLAELDGSSFDFARSRRRLHKGLPKQNIALLGCWRVKKSKKTPGALVISDEQPVTSSCPICLEDFKDACYVRALPCKHIFHKKCIDVWLGQNDTCPLDRSSLN